MAYYILTENDHQGVCARLERAVRWDRLHSHRGFDVSMDNTSVRIHGAHLDGVPAAKVTFHRTCGEINVYETRVLDWRVKLGSLLTVTILLLGGFGLLGGYLQTIPIAVLLGVLSITTSIAARRDEQAAAEWFALQIDGALYRSSRRMPIRIPNPFREMNVAYQKMDEETGPERQKPKKTIDRRLGPFLRL